MPGQMSESPRCVFSYDAVSYQRWLHIIPAGGGDVGTGPGPVAIQYLPLFAALADGSAMLNVPNARGRHILRPFTSMYVARVS